MLKVLFIHNEYQFKGGEDAVLEMEKSLLESKGHQVRTLLFTNTVIDQFTGKLKAGLQSLYNFSAARQLRETIIRFKPDIIHVHNLFFQASPSVLYLAGKMKIPVVMTVHNYRLICANALLLRNNHVCELCTQKVLPLSGIKYKCYRDSGVESALVTAITGLHKIMGTWTKKIDRLIVLSEFMKEKLMHSSLHFPANRTVVIPNFIDDVQGEPLPRDNYFLFVGRLSKEKGIQTLLDCFSKTAHQQLIIAGEGPEKERVLAAARENPGISYAGQQPKEKVLHLMKKSKALIFPSIWYEGLPMTIIEAFATGTPVIASELGSMAEMIRDGYNGFHFVPGNAGDLENKLDHFSNGQPGSSLYTNARQTYLDYYQPDVHYDAILGIYEKAIADRNASTIHQ